VRDPAHAAQLTALLQDLLGALARVLTEAEVVAFLGIRLRRDTL